jgi:hypothetical protein
MYWAEVLLVAGEAVPELAAEVDALEALELLVVLVPADEAPVALA